MLAVDMESRGCGKYASIALSVVLAKGAAQLPPNGKRSFIWVRFREFGWLWWAASWVVVVLVYQDKRAILAPKPLLWHIVVVDTVLVFCQSFLQTLSSYQQRQSHWSQNRLNRPPNQRGSNSLMWRTIACQTCLCCVQATSNKLVLTMLAKLAFVTGMLPLPAIWMFKWAIVGRFWTLTLAVMLHTFIVSVTTQLYCVSTYRQPIDPQQFKRLCEKIPIRVWHSINLCVANTLVWLRVGRNRGGLRRILLKLPVTMQCV